VPLDWPPQSSASFYDQWLERKAGRFALRRQPRADKALLERIHNVTLAPDMARLLALRDARTLNSQVTGPLEMDDGEITLHGTEGKNLVDALLEPQRQRFFRHTFAGLVPVGYLRNSQAEVSASVLPEPKDGVTPILGISHQSGGFHLANGVDALLTAVEAMQRNDAASVAGALAGKVGSDLEMQWLGLQPIQNCGHANRYFRAWWVFQLLGLIYSENVDQIVDNMIQGQNTRVGYDKALAAGGHLRSAGGMYLMWVQFLLKDPRLPALLDACGQASSPLLLDNVKLIRELEAGRKNVGPIADLHARREEFLAIAETRAADALKVFRG
jgi:hypothetical protein